MGLRVATMYILSAIIVHEVLSLLFKKEHKIDWDTFNIRIGSVVVGFLAVYSFMGSGLNKVLFSASATPNLTLHLQR